MVKKRRKERETRSGELFQERKKERKKEKGRGERFQERERATGRKELFWSRRERSLGRQWTQSFGFTSCLANH